MEASTPQDNTLQKRYPPTMDIKVGKGPRAARVYCASPPVVLGISAFNSDREAIVVILSRQAITMARIKITPTVPAPCPRETRQLVAITSPTDTEMTLPSPSFFSSICFTPSNRERRRLCRNDALCAALSPLIPYRASTPSSPVLTRITLSIL